MEGGAGEDQQKRGGLSCGCGPGAVNLLSRGGWLTIFCASSELIQLREDEY